MKPTNRDIANAFHLWQIYADPQGLDTEEDFNSRTEAEKIAFLEQCFGEETEE